MPKTIQEILNNRIKNGTVVKPKSSSYRKKMTIGAKRIPFKKRPRVTLEERLNRDRRSLRTRLIRKSLINYLKTQGHIRPLVHTIEEKQIEDEIIILFKQGTQPQYFLVAVRKKGDVINSRIPYSFDDVFQIDYFKYGRKNKRKNKNLTIRDIIKAGTLTKKAFKNLKEENIEEYKALKNIKEKIIDDVENQEFPMECVVYQ